MADVAKFSCTLGTIIFDFDNAVIRFDRNGCVYPIPSIEISFYDITDVELRPPKLLSVPFFTFIVNGKRLMKGTYDVAHFNVTKAEFPKVKEALERVVKECGLTGMKEYGRKSIPTGEYKPNPIRCPAHDKRIFTTYQSPSKGHMFRLTQHEILVTLPVSMGTNIPISNISTAENASYCESDVGDASISFMANGKHYQLYFRTFGTSKHDYINGLAMYEYIIKNSSMSMADMKIAFSNVSTGGMTAATAIALAKGTEKKDKDASVIGRAVAGAVIAGPAGAVVGALSAVDKNNKTKK